ncbi:Sulfur carrier protein ThiS [Vibrio aerogenes CECT 7868]|uniref:Sulfur carrier protein ThiS n=1 Tax=Vibrio aerogenes CECT 7868 TaxID=1216006 RepID=A0A1M5ZIK3_9VIBR|nr:sulfur carrier protein ThiS [Vibrio aerogenes]SHI24042.1 Sulfur carrier protein ThiS [Vibrio aerogenes CECT 7868]
MQIKINDQTYSFEDGLTLSAVIDRQTLPQSGSVYALNEQIIPKVNWEKTPLKDGDEIALFQVIAGG